MKTLYTLSRSSMTYFSVCLSLIAAPCSAAPDMTDGEIRKVDIDAKKITIKHGDIKNLDMPGMTMVFQVKDPSMLDLVKAGDKIKFSVEKLGGTFVITEIQSAK